MDRENVASEWYPFRIKQTKAFQCPASGGLFSRDGPRDEGERIRGGGVGMYNQLLASACVS